MVEKVMEVFGSVNLDGEGAAAERAARVGRRRVEKCILKALVLEIRKLERVTV